MKRILRKLLSILAYVAAGGIILLAVAVGLFRLLLPRLPAYQEDIKGWAAAAIGMEVEFSGMNARWRFSGPELNFYNAELLLPDGEEGSFAADEVSVGIDLMRLLLDRTFVVDSVLVRDAALDVSKGEDDRWRVQDIPLDVLSARFANGRGDGRMTIEAEDLDVTYHHPASGEIVDFAVSNLRMTRSPVRTMIDAVLVLPESLGNRLSIGVVGRNSVVSNEKIWQVSVDTRGMQLAGWSGLQPAALPTVTSGSADLSFSIEQRGETVSNALIEFDVSDVIVADDAAPFGADGRLEFQSNEEAWLVEADELRFRTERGTWPESIVNLQGGVGTDGRLTSLSASASYIDVDDLKELRSWLPEKFATYLREYEPTGRVENLALTLAELTSESPDYDLAMELSDAGILAGERLPGVRGFSGSVRANRNGGRIEILAADMELDLSRWLAEPVRLDSASGTVIWRRNIDGIIVLSDSVTLQNADLSSRSNVQVSLPSDGGAPVLDLESRWSISDLNAARRYLPKGLINPPLYSWLQGALVAGSVPTGTTRFSGALDRFPFDENEGIFRIEASMENATLRYSDRWPAVENLNLDLIVDRTRLYSEKNTAVNAGNSVVDAKIEIADLRNPVLTIRSLSTGTLESIRRFAQESPIADVFGGRLDQVAVAGNASFTLDLTYPIRNRDAFQFTTRVQTNDGTVRIEGFDAPITELNGIVNMTRDNIASESLFGRFLGESVNIDLQPADADAPGYSVVAEVDGRFTAAGLAAAFSLPLDGIMEGGSDYVARVSFPRSSSETQSPLQVTIASQLEGLAFLLPAPLGKAPEELRLLDAAIRFPAEGSIETSGNIAGEVQWALEFLRDAEGWDFDRGVLSLGGVVPGEAGSRGLHVEGRVAELRVGDWLAANPAGGGRRGGLAARIRSLDINVENLHVLGQHFSNHRVLVDRSSNNWLVKLEGEQVQGEVAIPYDFSSGRTLTLDMQRLILPGNEEDDAESEIATDPRELPPLSLKAAEFAFGDRYLGEVTAEFRKTPDGLEADEVHAIDRTFSIDGAAGWVIDTLQPSGQTTWVNARLVSSDIGATMQRLNFEPGIVGDDMEITFDVSWSGGPREDFVDELDGTVAVRFGTGQLDEVEPGAGRMFGLMSVVALPRRLALDFRDVLDKGFLFDEITGTFSIADGDAFTCDLSLKGPAADIGIVGRAGLQDRDYTQTAIVSANVGNTLPVVGAVVAGPQVAAALLIFSQIFKKPLQEVGQAYYAIDGSWDAPEVESADAARFAVVSRQAGCLETQR